jgi:hypothetical protein
LKKVLEEGLIGNWLVVYSEGCRIDQQVGIAIASQQTQSLRHAAKRAVTP